MNSGKLFGGAAAAALLAGLGVADPAEAVGAVPASIVVDNVRGDYVNLAPVPVRPMLWIDPVVSDGAGGDLYVASTHGNYVAHFDAQLSKLGEFRTLPGPSALAPFVGGSIDALAVVCQSADAVVLHDRATGRVLDIYEVRGEPADIVIPPGGTLAYVSVARLDQVVEINLALPSDASANRRVFALDAEKPLHLSVDASGDVFVAPSTSGNGTTALRRTKVSTTFPTTGTASSRGVVDTSTWLTPLTDEDLYRLDTSGGQLENQSWAEGAGALVYAHGQHPVSGDRWILTTDLHNDVAGKQALNGKIASHQAVVFDGVNRSSVPLDFAPPTALFSSVGLPFGLDFVGSEDAVIVGLLSKDLTRVSPGGRVVAQWSLVRGCIPRQVIAREAESRYLVLCEGLNEVLEVDATGSTAPRRVEIGFDPTPPQIAYGRRLFFDGQFSALGNVSCATCHPEGETDLLVWDLADLELDDPGPMMTLSLKASNRTGPHHWRGEQHFELFDFLGAFPTLLGATTPPNTFESIALLRYIHSLEPGPNPRQPRDRSFGPVDNLPDHLRSTSTTSPNSDRGANLFATSCNGCHETPTGHSGQLSDTPLRFDEFDVHRQKMKIAPLLTSFDRGLHPPESIQETASSTPIEVASRGMGMAHAGVIPSLEVFLELFERTPKDQDDLMAFVWGFDTGIAPQTRQSVLLDASSTPADTSALTALLDASVAGHTDVVSFGRLSPTATTTRYHFYRPELDAFETDVGTATVARSDLVAAAMAGGGWMVAHGVPRGSAERMSVDLDGDGVKNRDELRLGTNPLNPMSTGTLLDNEPNGLTPAVTAANIVWSSQRNVRVDFDTNEPVSWLVSYTDRFGEQRNFISPGYGVHHSVVLSGLADGFTTSVSYALWDSTPSAGVSGILPLSIAPDGGSLFYRTSRVAPSLVSTMGQDRTYRVEVQLVPTSTPSLGPTMGSTLAASVLEDGIRVTGLASSSTSTWVGQHASVASLTSLQLNHELVMTPLDASGKAVFHFTVPASHPGALRFKVEGFARVYANLPGTFVNIVLPLPSASSVANPPPHVVFSFAETPAALRNPELPR